MQTNQYEFRDNYAYKNGKRIAKKWDLLCEVESLAKGNYRLVWGHCAQVTTHYDHFTCAELVGELKRLIAENKRITRG
jgi:hypothetical protein